MNDNQIGINIAFYRKRAGMTQEALGQALSVSAQAVSRWERGGMPDIALIPSIADALGITLDVLFGRATAKHQDVEALLRLELQQTPEEKRVERAYQLSWHMIKVIANSCCELGDIYYRILTENENVNRYDYDSPSKVPVTNYFFWEDGLAQACSAQDFHYTLIMPEPELGFSSVMKRVSEYRTFFSYLAQEHYLDMLVLGYTIPTDCQFTSSFAAKKLGISQEQAEEILEKLFRLRLINRMEAQLSDEKTYMYMRIKKTLLVPLLNFAGEMMQSGPQHYYALSYRKAPVFREELGKDAIDPQWEPDDSMQSIQPGSSYGSR